MLATAGHPGPVLIKPDGSVQVLPGGGVPLGIFPDPEPATLELELTDGDVLFFFTDGLADARSRQATYFEDSLGDCLAQMAGRRAADIVSDMRKVVLDFCDGSACRRSDHARAQGRRAASQLRIRCSSSSRGSPRFAFRGTDRT